MAGPTSESVTLVNQVTRNDDNPNNSPILQDQILDHVSSPKALIKQHNERFGTLIEPIRLSFGEEDENDKVKRANKKVEDACDEDLKKPYKEDVLKVMQISAFMSNSMYPELARQISDQVPKTMTEMMRRVDDVIESEEVYRITELPRGNYLRKDKEHHTVEVGHPVLYTEEDNRGHTTIITPTAETTINRMFSLEQTTKELQLQLPPCPPMVGTPKKENLDRYCDYHGEKGHYINICYLLKRQLEAALKSRKLSHLAEDVRQRGNARGRQQGNTNGKGKVINMVWAKGDNQKRKSRTGGEEFWLNAPITFPPILADDVLDEPLIIEVEVKGYLVQRVFVHQGAAVQTELVGFFEEQLISIGKVELEVAFGNESIDNAFARFNTIIISLKALNEDYSSNNYVMKFLRALHPKWRAKVTTIKESKDLTSLSLDELIGNLKVHKMIIKKDSEIVKAKGERKSLALKAKKKSSDEESSTSGSEDEEYAMAVRDFNKFFKRRGRCGYPNHLIGECLKPPKDKNQMAFIGGSWSDSGEEDDEKVKGDTCLMT
ncbi:hypothetical protein Tco_0298357 [Tanacetum coccineum]